MHDRTNNENTEKLIADIQRTGRSYIPVYGGFHDTKTYVTDSYEPSFSVTNYDREGNVMNFEKLKAFAIKMCGRYNQHCVKTKAPNDIPHFTSVPLKSGILLEIIEIQSVVRIVCANGLEM